MNVNAENVKTSKVSSSAVAKTIKRYDETGSHEDHHRKGRPSVTSAAEDTFIRVTSLRNWIPNKCFRVQVTDFSTLTVQRRMCEIRPSWSNCCKETTTKKDTNKKRHAWAKKHEQWTLDQWNTSDFWFQPPSRCR